MHITVESNVFAVASQAESLALLDLLNSVVHHRHTHAVLTNPLYIPGGNNGPIDHWIGTHSQHEARAFRKVLEIGPLAAAGTRSVSASDSAQPRRWHLPGPVEIRVQRRQASDWQQRKLTIADAADFLREPLHLVLENSRTDLAFVRHLSGPTNGAELSVLLDRPGRVAVHGGGGGEVKKWIEHLTTGPQTPAKWRRLLRAWVLFDRDAGDRDALAPSDGALELLNACETVTTTYGPGLSWICMCRRELESYVPDTGLQTIKNAKQAAFVSRVLAWRGDPKFRAWAWALDLKKGLHGDRHSTWTAGLSKDTVEEIKCGKQVLQSHMLKPPFNSLDATTVAVLARGLGDAVSEALVESPEPAWTADFPDEYDRGPIEQAPRPALVQALLDRM